MEPKSSSPQTTRELMKIANSPDGKKLLNLVQQQGGAGLSSAMQQAESGDYSSIEELITKIMDNPEAGELIKRIRGSHE